MIKFRLPAIFDPKRAESEEAPPDDYPGCDREIPRVPGVPATSSLGCADACEHGGHCQREKELLK